MLFCFSLVRVRSGCLMGVGFGWVKGHHRGLDAEYNAFNDDERLVIARYLFPASMTVLSAPIHRLGLLSQCLMVMMMVVVGGVPRCTYNPPPRLEVQVLYFPL